MHWEERSNSTSRPLGRVIFYILSPALVFEILTSSKLAVENILLMMGYAASTMIIIAGIAFIAGKILRLGTERSDHRRAHQFLRQQRQLWATADLLCLRAGSPGIRQHLLRNEFPAALHCGGIDRQPWPFAL